jgi:hypothetical protein
MYMRSSVSCARRALHTCIPKYTHIHASAPRARKVLKALHAHTYIHIYIQVLPGQEESLKANTQEEKDAATGNVCLYVTCVGGYIHTHVHKKQDAGSRPITHTHTHVHMYAHGSCYQDLMPP